MVRPPVDHRFDLIRKLRKYPHQNKTAELEKNNRMYALLQQQEFDKIQSNLTKPGEGKLKHTDFEGYRAISGNKVNKLPDDFKFVR